MSGEPVNTDRLLRNGALARRLTVTCELLPYLVTSSTRSPTRMFEMAVPSLTSAGLLPPYTGRQTDLVDRSPYEVSLEELITALGTTATRHQILGGLLDYRQALHGLGFHQGFQWIDGSFCTDIEALESRSPGDIDVVTFLTIPQGVDKQALVAAYPEIFNSVEAKKHYKCDAYVVELDMVPEGLVFVSAYWSNVWGHTRGNEWKGFLQIDLDPSYDNAARNALLAAGVAP